MTDYDKLKARLRERAIFGTATTEQAADAISVLQAELSATQKSEHDANVAAMNNLRRAEAAEDALVEARTVQAAAKVLLAAMERAQVSMVILRKLHNGEPVAALRALAEGDRA